MGGEEGLKGRVRGRARGGQQEFDKKIISRPSVIIFWKLNMKNILEKIVTRIMRTGLLTLQSLLCKYDVDVVVFFLWEEKPPPKYLK